VLVADEQEDQHKLLRHHLDGQARLTFARTLDDALEAARRRRVAAVLVSAGLSPEAGSARDLAERFRALSGYDDTPLIVLDEDALPGAAEQFEAEGFDGYVARPLKQTALLNALGDALEDDGAAGPVAAMRSEGAAAEEQLEEPRAKA
jgi:CheY-like chemotaxis protein